MHFSNYNCFTRPINHFLWASIVAVSLLSCKVNKQSAVDQRQYTPDTTAISEIPEKTTNFEIKPYRPEATRDFVLIHTRLDLTVDWKNKQLIGKAGLILKPYFYKQAQLVLDAKNFDIQSVGIATSAGDTLPEYSYDGRKLIVKLGREVSRNEQININIAYVAKGYEGDTASIKPDDQQGFYFVNPEGIEGGLPQQVWTQGETECNSRWFPTLDAPNQKTTAEIFLTVENKFTTLSNGKLVYSRQNQDNTRTDYWKMDNPHAPYLFMFAAGDFQVIEDNVGDMQVNYYVEPAYAPYARDIFGNTPEMISFYGELLKVPFPWSKYSQIIVRNFVTGAMENTTATVFMEDLNMDRRELLDFNYEDIIAHELFHQWFGDYVTCESWANLPLNESFATYGEYLWFYHKYGADEASFHLLEDLENYLEESKTKNEHLVRFDYTDSEEMFDSHSYAKGGLILHALRNYIGDEAFFKSLELYLKTHAYGKAEAHELRLVFEQITGEDLNWFFNQWFYDAGHPILSIEEEYDSTTKTAILKVRQIQDLNLYPAFKLDLTLDMWQGDSKEQFIIGIDRPYQEFEFTCTTKPDLFLVDSEHILVGRIEQAKTTEQLVKQYVSYPDNMRARLESLRLLLEQPMSQELGATVSKALSDSFWVIRQEALDFFEQDSTGFIDNQKKMIMKLAVSDPKPAVRTSAFAALVAHPDEAYCDVYQKGLADSSYTVAGYALYGYLHCDMEDKDEVIEKYKGQTNFNITSTLADYFISEKKPNMAPWFIERIGKYRDYELWYFVKFFGMYLSVLPQDDQSEGIARLNEMALGHQKFFIRLAAYQSLQLLEDTPGVVEMLQGIKAAEQDPRVLKNMD